MAKPIQIGKMRQRPTFQKPDGPLESQDPSGQVIPSWVDVCTVFAEVKGVVGGEVWYGHQMQGDVTVALVMRYRQDVQEDGPRWRFRHRGRSFYIRSVIDADEARRFMMVQAVEQV